jgi:integrase
VRLKDYDEREGKRVWLSEDEMELLVEDDTPKRDREKVALLLAGRCGLRRQEIVDVAAKDLVHTDTGQTIRVWDGKGDKYREVPAPPELTNLALRMDREEDEPLVDVDPSTIYDWVERERQRCYAATGDEGWDYVGPHDLRRSWGVRLLESGVLPSVVMEFGGWEDWTTFRDHYLAEFSPEALRREREKIPWLGGEPQENAAEPAVRTTASGANHYR